MKGNKPLHWEMSQVSQDETHHLLDEKPIYLKRFFHVLPFHAPGLAPVLDATGAYHIDLTGKAMYPERYTRTFGFYFRRASVNHLEKWWHIFPDGARVYRDVYEWCGNFQDNVCAVRDDRGFFHIDGAGNRLYPETYRYVGDFHDGIAVVQTEGGLHTHIDLKGQKVHSHFFLDLDMYHKGYARAKNNEGWLHINRSGLPLYQERYSCVEPFYNGLARVETMWGEILRINERGIVLEILRRGTIDPFHEVSKDLVSYWKLFTLKAAQDYNLFDLLPSSLAKIASQTTLSPLMVEALLLALKEIGYLRESKLVWSLTTLGAFLSSDHSFSLKEAQILWMGEHFNSWNGLSDFFKTGAPPFENQYQMPWFDFLARHPDKERQYHQAISQYAKWDYRELAQKIDCSSAASVADIGGSTGAALNILMDAYPQLEGHLIDLPSVIDQIQTPLRKQLHVYRCDFFGKWPKLKVDVALLCRVIHDWENKQATHILKQAHTLLKNRTSRLLVIENILDKHTGKGALLNLNMRVMTGGQERTLETFCCLFEQAGFFLDSHMPLHASTSIFVLRPLT